MMLLVVPRFLDEIMTFHRGGAMGQRGRLVCRVVARSMGRRTPTRRLQTWPRGATCLIDEPADPSTIAIRAEGDLDGDGSLSRFERRGQLHAAARAIHELVAELSLERADRLADPRLGHAQALGRTPEVQLLGQREKDLDVA